MKLFELIGAFVKSSWKVRVPTLVCSSTIAGRVALIAGRLNSESMEINKKTVKRRIADSLAKQVERDEGKGLSFFILTPEDCFL